MRRWREPGSPFSLKGRQASATLTFEAADLPPCQDWLRWEGLWLIALGTPAACSRAWAVLKRQECSAGLRAITGNPRTPAARRFRRAAEAPGQLCPCARMRSETANMSLRSSFGEPYHHWHIGQVVHPTTLLFDFTCGNCEVLLHRQRDLAAMRPVTVWQSLPGWFVQRRLLDLVGTHAICAASTSNEDGRKTERAGKKFTHQDQFEYGCARKSSLRFRSHAI